MQKYTNGTDIRYFDDGVKVSDYIKLTQYRLMTADEIDRHENPEKYLSADQKLQLTRQRMPRLAPMDFELKLVNFGLYDQVQTLVESDIKLKIAYTRATYFSRTDPFIEQARIALNLTNDQIDQMWTAP